MLDRAAMTRAFDEAEKAFGTVTILVNNAGVAHSDPRHRPDRGGMAARLGTNLDAVFFWAQEARAAHAGRQASRARSSTSPRCSGFGVSQGHGRLCDRQGRRDPDDQGAGARTRLQGRARQRHRAGLVRHRDQPRLSRRASRARRSSATFRSAASARTAISTARCCCSRPTPAATWPARPSWSTAARWCAMQRARGEERSWTSRSRPRSKTSACACAPSSRSTCCRSKPIRRISTSTRTSARRAARRVREKAQRGRPVGAAVAEGIWRHGAADRRLGGDVRGGRRSIFGPLAFNCMAPDDGNMNLLAQGRHAGAEGKMAASRSSTARCARPSR